jgi:hypothetical protein
MTSHEWAVFGTFALMVTGLSFFSPATATYVGLGAAAVIVIRNPGILGLQGSSGSSSGSSSAGSTAAAAPSPGQPGYVY